MHDWIIIGAGISGLLCAAELKKGGVSVLVLDKGRGPGGRLASRSLDNGARIDFGAQFFTAYDELFKKHVNNWLALGLVEKWLYSIPALNSNETDNSEKYIATEGLRAIARYLAEQVKVRQQSEVEVLQPIAGGWQLQTKSGKSYSGRGIILSAPLPQALQLVQSSKIVLPGPYNIKLRRTLYEPCLALMIQGTVKAPAPVFTLQNHPVQLVADNYQKGISDGKDAVTVHCAPDFSRMAWDWPGEKVIRYIVDALQPHAELEVKAGRVHRWRYSRVANPQEEPYADMQQKAPLFLAGDAFGGARVEGAALSGLKLAKHILEQQ